jgi:DNA-damage-inducible protein D
VRPSEITKDFWPLITFSLGSIGWLEARDLSAVMSSAAGNNIAPFSGGGSQSPFDQLRQVRQDGSEYWSARDLQTPAGYQTWAKFSDAIDRAMAACQNSGQSAPANFAATGKVNALGQTLQDYELSRYGAYLLFMNGDPRKPEIAQAQTYFAIKTREAETLQASTDIEFVLEQALAQTRLRKQREREAIEAREREAAALAQVVELTPKAEAHDVLQVADHGSRTIAQVAHEISTQWKTWKESELRAYLIDNGWIYKKRKDCGKDEYVAKADYKKHFQAKETVLNTPPMPLTKHNGGKPCAHYTLYMRQTGVDLLIKRLGIIGSQDAAVQVFPEVEAKEEATTSLPLAPPPAPALKKVTPHAGIHHGPRQTFDLERQQKARHLRSLGYTFTAIGQELGLDRSTIGRLLNGKTHKDVI